MKRRTLILVVIIVGVLSVAGYLTVNWLIHRSISKENVEARLKQSLGLNVRISEVSFSLWSGLQLEKVRVGPFLDLEGDREPLIRVDEISIQTKFWSLVRGDWRGLVAVISSPEITFSRNQKGEWNWGSPDTSPGYSHQPSRTTTELSSAADSLFTLKELQLRSGTIRVRDQLNTETFSISFQDVRMTDFTDTTGGSVELNNFRFPGGGSLTARGSVQFDTPSVFLRDVQLHRVNPGFLRSYFKGILPRNFSSGTRLVEDGRTPSWSDLRVSGTLTSFRGWLAGSRPASSWKITSQLKTLKLIDSRQFRSLARLEGAFWIEPSRVTIKQFTGHVAEAPFTVNGRIFLGTSQPTKLALNGELGPLSLAKVVSYDTGLSSLVESLQGTVRVSPFQLEGSLKRPELRGGLQSDTLQWDPPWKGRTLEMSQVEASLTANTQRILLEGLNGRTLGGRLSGRVRVFSQGDSPPHLSGRLESVPLSKLKTVVPPRTFPESLSLKGDLTLPIFEIGGHHQDPALIRGRIWIPALNLNSPGVDQPFTLESVKGRWTVGSDRLHLSKLSTRVAGHGVKLGGTVPYRSQGSNFKIRGYVKGIPAGWLEKHVAGSWFPDGFVPKGTLSLRNVKLRETSDGWSGTGRLTDSHFSLKVPDRGRPVTIADVGGKIRMTSDTASIKNFTGNVQGRFDGGTIDLSGSLRLGNRSPLDLKITADTFPISFLTSKLSGVPKFPEGWKPRGTFQTTTRLKGTLQEPRFRGEFDTQKLYFGAVQAHDVHMKYTFQEGTFKAHSIRAKLFNGQVEGNLSLQKIEEHSELSINNTVKSLGIGALLDTVTGTGEKSEGAVKGDVRMSGPVGKIQEFDGRWKLRGGRMVFRDVKMLDQLSTVLNTNLIRVLETGLGGTIYDVLTLQFFRGGRRLQSLITSRATTHFDRGRALITFEKGKGHIKKLYLENNQVTLKGSGTVWLDGRLGLTVSVNPRAPVLNKIEKEWLRGILSGGFPELKVEGTIYEPRFNQEQLRRGLLQRLFGFIPQWDSPLFLSPFSSGGEQ